MQHLMFSVYDSKAEAFLPPFVMPRSAQAVRIFSDCIQSDEHQFGQNPADYTLFRIGHFDDENAIVKAEITPVIEITGLDCSRSPFLDTEKSNGEETKDGKPPILPGPASENPTVKL